MQAHVCTRIGVILYTYKFLRDDIFADWQFSGCSRFHFWGILIFHQVYLLESIEVTLIVAVCEDENFVESKATAKSVKITSLINLYVHGIAYVLDGSLK